MIENQQQYERVCAQLQQLEIRLARLQKDHPGPELGLTKAGVRKMISRLHEDLAMYEGEQEVEQHQQPSAQS